MRLASLALLALASLTIASFAPACSAEDEAEVRSRILLVVGTGAKCADQVRAIDLKASTRDNRFYRHRVVVDSAEDLPASTQLDLASDGQSPHDLTATFVMAQGSSTLSVPLHVRVPAGAQGRVTLSLPCVCIGVVCPEEAQCAELPLNSGKTQCVAVATCGDGTCQASESQVSCAQDCGALCGDGVCDAKGGETCGTCAADCNSCCGNGTCEADESRCTCAQDCGVPACGQCGTTCGAGGSSGSGGASGGGGGASGSSAGGGGQSGGGGGASGGSGGAGGSGQAGSGGSTGEGGSAGSAGSAGGPGQAGSAGQPSGCGDGVCGSDESCGSCYVDCGADMCAPGEAKACVKKVGGQFCNGNRTCDECGVLGPCVLFGGGDCGPIEP